MTETRIFGQRSTAPLADKPGALGIGGWLLILPLVLVLAPIAGLYELRNTGTTWQMLNQLPAMQMTFLINEAIWNAVLLIVLPLVLLVLFFRKSRYLPRFAIGWLIVLVVFVFADLAFAYAAFRLVFDTGAAPLFGPDVIRDIAQSVIAAGILVPYLLRSQRVRDTFVN